MKIRVYIGQLNEDGEVYNKTFIASFSNKAWAEVFINEAKKNEIANPFTKIVVEEK